MLFKPQSYRAKAVIAAMAIFFALYVLAHDTLVARPYVLADHSDSTTTRVRSEYARNAYFHDCPLEHGGIIFDGQVTFDLSLESLMSLQTALRDSLHSYLSVYSPLHRGPPSNA